MPKIGKNWRGMYPGSYAGNLWAAHNIDLERKFGRLMLSNKMRTFSTGNGVVLKFLRTNADTTDRWWGLTSGDMLRNSTNRINAGTWATDALSNSPNDPRDMIVHEAANGEDRLVVSRATDIAILNLSGAANIWTASWWDTTLAQTALTSDAFHPLARLQRLLAVGDKVSDVPVIHTIDKDDVVSASRLLFPIGYRVRLAMASSNRFWFGLENERGGTARIIEWDGSSLTYNNEYDLQGQGTTPLTGFIVDDIPYYITERGYISRYTGGGFKIVGNFLLDEEREAFTTGIGSEGNISSYGAFPDSHLVYILASPPIRFSTGVTRGARRLRSGIYIFNTRNGNLYHHMGLGEHSSAGTDVNYSDSPLDEVGAVYKSQPNANTDYPLVVASASVYTGGASFDSSTQNGIYEEINNWATSSNAGRNRGWFITPYIPIEDIEVAWDALWLKFRRFVDSGNRIIVKWRVVDPLRDTDAGDDSPVQAGGTWVSTTTFTCVVPTGVVVGDEVEVMTGDNAGCLFNISTLSATPDGSTTITVTIDEVAPTSSTDTSLFRFDNFKTETAISSTSIGNKKVPFTSITNGEFIQIKIELRGFSVELDELEPVAKVITQSKQA